MAYVVWILASNFTLLSALSLVTRDDIDNPPGMSAVNNNGMVVFIVANLLTGLVNITVDTLNVGSFYKELAIIVIYMFVIVVVVAVGLDKMKGGNGFNRKGNKND